jgi:MtN3 and saliva related transmembrane protein
MQYIDIAGFAGMIMIAVALAPQIIKSWKTKSTKDISVMWNSIYLLGLLSWLVYGIGINSLPLILSGILESSLAFSLLVLKLRYG